MLCIAPDNYLEHRFGNFSVGTRALLRTFSANRGTYVLSDLEHMRILYLEHAIIYTCKYMYMYTYIQLNTAYLYYIYRWCDDALKIHGDVYIEVYLKLYDRLSGWNGPKAYSGTRFEINRYIYWAEQNEANGSGCSRWEATIRTSGLESFYYMNYIVPDNYNIKNILYIHRIFQKCT